MGLFYETKPITLPVTQALTDAYAADPLTAEDAQRIAATTVSRIRAEASSGGLKVGRLVASVVIFGLLVGGGIATEATGLSGSSQALYGFAGSVFGVVVGFLGSEKPGNP